MRDLIIVDVETTGLDVTRHWVLEVAAINLTTGEELYFVPSVSKAKLAAANSEALRINRYVERGVRANQLDWDDTREHWGQLWSWLDGNTLAGSNPVFDAGMLNRSGGSTGGGWWRTYSPWHHRLVDLSAYAAGALGIPPTELPGADVVCERLGVVNEDPHSALGDARATAECFRRIIGTRELLENALWSRDE